MKKIEMETFRNQLLNLKGRLNGDADTLADEVFHKTDEKPLGDLSNSLVEDRAERASDNSCAETTIGLFENTTERLRDINAALARIDEGTYGRCTECGQEIARDRLHSVPFVPQCIACARLAQRGQVVAPGNL